jgi:hypothetical protein
LWDGEAGVGEGLGEEMQDGIDPVELGEHLGSPPDDRASCVILEEVPPGCCNAVPLFDLEGVEDLVIGPIYTFVRHVASCMEIRECPESLGLEAILNQPSWRLG